MASGCMKNLGWKRESENEKGLVNLESVIYMEPKKLKKYANLMNDPEKFLQALKEDEAM